MTTTNDDNEFKAKFPASWPDASRPNWPLFRTMFEATMASQQALAPNLASIYDKTIVILKTDDVPTGTTIEIRAAICMRTNDVRLVKVLVACIPQDCTRGVDGAKA